MPTAGASSSSERGPYWTIREVAAHYRLHPETVRKWIAKGAIKGVRLGAGPKPRIRIRRDEVQ